MIGPLGVVDGGKLRDLSNDYTFVYGNTNVSFVNTNVSWDLSDKYSRIVRFTNTTDFIIDTTYATSGFSKNPNGMLITSGDKLYVCGAIDMKYGGIVTNGLIRLDSGGTIDNTFNIGTGFNNDVYSMDVDVNGKLVLGGSFTTFKGQAFNRLVRLNDDGTLDTTFNSFGTGFGSSAVRVVKADNQGGIYVGGDFTTLNGGSRKKFTKLNNNGSSDTTFNTTFGNTLNGTVYAMHIDAIDGSIIIQGGISSWNSFSCSVLTTIQGVGRCHIFKVSSGGTINTTFGAHQNCAYCVKVHQNVSTSNANFMVLDNGNIIQSNYPVIFLLDKITGYPIKANWGSSRSIVNQSNSEGTTDTIFSRSNNDISKLNYDTFDYEPVDIFTNKLSYMVNMVIDSQNKLITTGNFITPFTQDSIVKLDTVTGERDMTFKNDFINLFGAPINVSSMVINPSGDIEIGGQLDAYGDAPINGGNLVTRYDKLTINSVNKPFVLDRGYLSTVKRVIKRNNEDTGCVQVGK